MKSKRRLAAIMFTDIVGYTALMGRDELKALETLKDNRELQRPLIKQYNGEWLKEMGDGVLASFDSTSDALRCATRIISAAKLKNIELRIGIHLGEVVFRAGDVFGDGVNVASRVEAMGKAGSVLFTERVLEDILNKPDLKAVLIGPATLKGVSNPVNIYALSAEGLTVPKSNLRERQGITSEKKVAQNNWLKPTMVGIIAILVLIVGAQQVFFTNNDSAGSPTPTGAITLAAIPFSNISRETEIDFLGFALVDQVISSLSYLKNVTVRPSSSIRQYGAETVLPQEIGEALDVRFVLMGHYIKNGNVVRLNIELIAVNENEVLWRGSVQEDISDVFKLQDIVAQKVIEGLEIQFSQDERNRMVKDTPNDPVAYQFYLQSLDLPYSVDGSHLAVEMLNKAAELDSNFAPIFYEIGSRTQQLAAYAFIEDRSTYMDRAIDALEYALELNDGFLNALGTLSLIRTELNQQDEALYLARRMISLNPNNAAGHFALGYLYRYAGMLDEAVNEMEIAVRLDPKDRLFRSIGITYNMAGHYKQAIASLEGYLDGSGFAENWIGVSYMKLDDFENARIWISQAWETDSIGSFGLFAGARLAFLDGSAKDWINRIRQLAQTVVDSEALYLWAVLSVMLEDNQQGLTMINKAVDRGYYPYRAFEINPFLDPVRDDPEFQRIMEKAKIKHEAFRAKHF
jgi:class 3 adenylate cyclase/TolB-like protein